MEPVERQALLDRLIAMCDVSASLDARPPGLGSLWPGIRAWWSVTTAGVAPEHDRIAFECQTHPSSGGAVEVDPPDGLEHGPWVSMAFFREPGSGEACDEHGLELWLQRDPAWDAAVERDREGDGLPGYLVGLGTAGEAAAGFADWVTSRRSFALALGADVTLLRFFASGEDDRLVLRANA